MSQINIFDILNEQNTVQKESFVYTPYNLYTLVRVLQPNKNLDPENYYYLSEFKNLKGIITVIHASKSFSYTVDFGNNKSGIFYHSDIELV